MNITKHEIKNQLAQIEELPTLSLVAQKVIALTKDPKSSAADLQKVIKADTALTAKVLKIVNSAYYGFPSSITSISQAIVILGFKTIRNLAMSVSILENVFKNARGYEDVWEHSVITAITSQTVAEKFKYINVEEVFIAGIIHDIGKIILSTYFPETVDEVLDYSNDNHITFYEAERKIMDTNHALIGGWLLKKWEFPQILIDAVKYHHTINKLKENDVIRYVYLGDVVARLMGYSCGDSIVNTIDFDVWQDSGLTVDMLRDIINTSKKMINNAKGFFEV
jgi:putative nucleotidyltransferase with HDIG domain